MTGKPLAAPRPAAPADFRAPAAPRATPPAAGPPRPERPAAPRSRVLLAFAILYVVWGSTYLGIRVAIETLPPFFMAAARFLVAGSALYVYARLRAGSHRPTAAEWRAAGIVGTLLLVGGNGSVVWAEQRVASGVASLIVATVPLWMVLLDWARPGGRRPTLGVAAGLALGTLGLVVLVGPGALVGRGAVDAAGMAALLAGSLSWAAGSVYAQRARMPDSPLLGTAMEMLVGGALLVPIALVAGERVAPASVSLRSAMALLYLIVFGSLVGYTAYTWLLQVASPARLSTYAYVNPVVAVVLGWAILGEPLTTRTWAAAAIIVAGVAVITATRKPVVKVVERER